MSDDVKVQFGAAVEGLLAGLKTATGGVKDFSDQVKSQADGITSSFKKLQEVMLGIAAVVAGGAMFKDMIRSTLEATGEVTKLQKTFGLTLEQANLTKSSLDLLGIAIDDYVSMAMRLDRQLRTGSDALAKMGLTAKDLDLGQKGVMDKAITLLGSYKEGIDRNIAATVLFGRGGDEALKLVKLGMDGVTAKARELEEAFGLTITKQDQQNAREYKLVVTELGMAFDGIKKAIGSAVLPYLTEFGNWFVEKTPIIIQAMKDNMKSIVEGGFAAAQGFINFVTTVATGVYNLFVLWQYIKTKMGSTTEGEALASIDQFGATIDSLNKFRDNAIKTIDEIKAKVLAAKPFENLNLNLGKGAQGTKSATGLLDDGGSGKDALSAAMREVDGQIRVLREGLNQKRQILETEYQAHQITEGEKVEATRQAVDQEYSAELALLQKELSLGNLSLTQRQQVLNKIAELEEKHRTDQVKMDSEAVAARTKIFQNMFDALQGAFNGQLRGLLAGTTSLKQAMMSTLGDLIISFIQYVAKIGFEWVAGQLGMTAATASGATARAAAETAAQEATLPARIGFFTSQLMSSAGLTFAGIMANLSPALGPLAAGPAAAGEATVMAQMANVPKLAVGTPWVQSDGLAYLHRGERVVPAAVNAPDGSGAGPGGATHHHWNVQALDARSFAAYVRENAGMINKILSGKAALTA
ncbi:hypothetical protein ABIB07_001843 [Bradyrhizobium sp. RT10b]